MPRTLTMQQYSDRTGAALNDFLNSLFDDWPGPFNPNPPGPLFRAGLFQQIKNSETNNQLVPRGQWLICDETKNLFINALMRYWHGNPRGGLPFREITTDKAFIHLISQYIHNHDLHLIVPAFECANKQNNDPSTYRIRESNIYAFKQNANWVTETIETFLELFLLGAHFVIIQSEDDLLGHKLPDFFELFKRLPGSGRAGHSHYTGHKVSLNGRNYPALTLNTVEGANLDKLTNATQAPLLPVVLCDHTSDAYPNAFFQMEGWPPGKSMYGMSRPEYRYKALAGGYRHGADFDTHGKTFWNISTYGASPFSEKRGGTVFLAPIRWTHVRKYRGFGGHYAGHDWYQHKTLTW